MKYEKIIVDILSSLANDVFITKFNFFNDAAFSGFVSKNDNLRQEIVDSFQNYDTSDLDLAIDWLRSFINFLSFQLDDTMGSREKCKDIYNEACSKYGLANCDDYQKIFTIINNNMLSFNDIITKLTWYSEKIYSVSNQKKGTFNFDNDDSDNFEKIL